MKKLLHPKWLSIFTVVVLSQLMSCKKDDPIPEVISSFTFAADAVDFKKITFTNTSTNADTYSWDFGDGTTKSTEANPVHSFPGVGKFNVSLTATNGDGKTMDLKLVELTISDPDAQLTMLVGDVSKTWKMVREGSATATRYPLQVGPLKSDGATRDGIWWRFGKDEDLAKRPCFLNDEYTFTRAGLTFTRDLKGDFYAGDGGIYAAKPAGPEFSCQSVGAAGTVQNKEGVDITAWRNMTGTFVLGSGTTPTLKVVGNGAYIGLEKVASNLEVKVPQADVTYNINKLVDGVVDTLVISVNYKFNAADAKAGAYWQFVLVHYDVPSQEPPIPSPKPVAKFTATISGNTLTTTNTSTDGVTYSWDFGDGTTSNSTAPVKTYDNDGIYNVTLTATNTAGTNTSGAQLFVANASTPALTDALLQGGAWKVRADNLSVFVGPGLGKSDWFDVGKARLTGASPGGTGADDWSCLVNDEFTFSTGGVFGYDTKGNARNDGYFEGPAANGCVSDAELAAVTNDGKKFRTFAAHTYVLVPAAGATRATITVTDGASDAKAFVGFYKGYNGGENGDKTKAAGGATTSVKYEVLGYAKNATKEYLFISVDYSGSQNGSQAWSTILVR